MAQFDYQKAVDAGYSPDEIKQFLDQHPDFKPISQATQTLQPTEQPATPGNFNIQAALDSGYTYADIQDFLKQNPGLKSDMSSLQQEKMFPEAVPVTQDYMNYNPSTEVFSGGYNTGIDLGAKTGTPVALPPGKWQVVHSFNGAEGGYIGNDTNSGYGNSVVVQNADSGDSMRLSHLSKNYLKEGQTIDGGMVIGKTGQTGNTTGPHLDLEYYDPSGKLGDVRKSPYAQYLPIQ